MGDSNIWAEISALSVLGVAIFSGMGWVYKQLSRLISKRFDDIDRKLKRNRKQSRKAKVVARRAEANSLELKDVVDKIAATIEKNNDH